MIFISLFSHRDLKNVPTRSTFTGITILVGTFGPHNVMDFLKCLVKVVKVCFILYEMVVCLLTPHACTHQHRPLI